MEILANRIGGSWSAPSVRRLPVVDPATGTPLAEAPLSTAEEVDRAVQAASRAFPDWRRTPPGDRVQPLFKLKGLLESNLNALARTITQECGKTLAESAFRAKAGITVIAILRQPEPVTGAQPTDTIERGDTLVTVGKAGQYPGYR